MFTFWVCTNCAGIFYVLAQVNEHFRRGGLLGDLERYIDSLFSIMMQNLLRKGNRSAAGGGRTKSEASAWGPVMHFFSVSLAYIANLPSLPEVD